MTTLDGDIGGMNYENQLQVAYATIAVLKDQIDSLQKSAWAAQESARIELEARASDRAYYENLLENQRKEMDSLRKEQQKLIADAVAVITKELREQIERLTAERDAARLSARQQRGKLFGRKSERNAGRKGNDGGDGRGENREEEKNAFTDPEEQRKKDAEKAAADAAGHKDGDTIDTQKLIRKLKRQHPGAEIEIKRIDYSKAEQYMTDDKDVIYHSIDSYFSLSEGEYFRTGKGGEVEKSCIRVLIRYPERYEEHIYEVASVRSRDNDEYKTSDKADIDRPVPGCIFSKSMLIYVLTEKYVYHTPFRQIVKKLRQRGLDIPKSVLGEHIHKAIEWLDEKLAPFWTAVVRKSWMLMIDETRTLVGCKDPDTEERRYKNKYMWGIRANSLNLAWFVYENGSRGAEAIRPFLDAFVGFYTTDGYIVYKIFDSKVKADAEEMARRSGCLVHIRRKLIDALPENYEVVMWFLDEFGKMFAVDHYCMKHGLKGPERLAERLKKGNTADIMKRIEERLDVFRQSGYAGCGELLTKALKYMAAEWPAMKRVLEDGDVELSNNLTEQMMRNVKMNLKTAGNIGSEDSARHNAFMYSVIESCGMMKQSVEDYLSRLLDKLPGMRKGDDLTCCLPCYLTA